MKLNQKLIKQLRNGEIAVENSGTLEQLREVLKAAFPEDSVIPAGIAIYYSRSEPWIGGWIGSQLHINSQPTVKISDFYQPEPFTGWAKDDRFPEWMFYFKDDDSQFGFDGGGYWISKHVTYHCKYSSSEANRPATHEEIEKHLTQEAKRRGYKAGNYKCLALPSYTHNVCCGFYYNEEDNQLHHGNKACATNVVFKKGQWAEIVEQPSQFKPKDKTNPIHYTVDGTTYSLNYQELKAKYESVVNYSDEQFMENLPDIAHLACIISYFKGLGVQATISDKGIIHELIHLMTAPEEPTNDLQEIREKFNKLIQLV